MTMMMMVGWSSHGCSMRFPFISPTEEAVEKALEMPAEASGKDVPAAPAPVFEDPEERADVEEAQAPEFRFSFCPDGWFKHGARCFRFVNSPMSWHNAEEYCNSLGAHLPSASNPSEYRFLQQLTQTAGQANAWLGGFYLQTRWMWIDSQGFYYANWYSQVSPTSCPCLYLNLNRGWSNGNCASSFRFICTISPGSC
ncbi:ladderlectin-like [Myripristis murdjan]|uniref:ladderlectin-like n=1 Tax=Myripristis murdjan TaxID=586833 RepID=UPI001175FC66|nr:ladderlectin-like [Myripristis murdjan]